MLARFRACAQLSRLCELSKGGPASGRARRPTAAALCMLASHTPWSSLHTRHGAATVPLAGTVVEGTAPSELASREVLRRVDAQVAGGSHGRLFAVVFIHGKQYKVTAEDLIVVQANMPVDVGDSLRLEKVLLVGARDFTLVGRPLLSGVRVDATVVEKTLSQQVRNFVFRRRSRFQRHYFYRFPFTVLRINAIRLPAAC
ncbi:39S ribosomal protein L21, mitochondrial [Ixodes scapularis]|uniref:39S ribosomal protein L21, mitochondrial n=1 Tax=Ixodes scapularis TaxID=6945 RepID=UPI001C395824|nr:39S ribosomal protein L21, mitochondrial [Ixodes scapularis]